MTNRPARREAGEAEIGAVLQSPAPGRTTAARLVASGIEVDEAGALDAMEMLSRLASEHDGLTSEEARRRLDAGGPNAVRSHRARPWTVLGASIATLSGLYSRTRLPVIRSLRIRTMCVCSMVGQCAPSSALAAAYSCALRTSRP